MAGRWRTEARDELALETIDTVLQQLPGEARALVQSHTPTRARVLARADYLSHLAVAQGQLAVALNAEVKIGETLGMFRDAAQDQVTLALVDALKEAALAHKARVPSKTIEVVSASPASLPPAPAPTLPST